MEPSLSKPPLLDANWWRAGDGARLRWYCWTAVTTSKRGVLLLLNGRSEFLEKWDETSRDFAARGFDVFSLDWRGQGLSTRHLSGTDKGHIDHFDTYTADISGFFSEIVRPAASDRPIFMLAHSMGAHIGLRFLGDKAPSINAAVLVAPMIGFNTGGLGKKLAHSMAWIASRIGFAKHYTIGGGPYNPNKEPFEGNVLTSDPIRYQVRNDYFEAYPELRVGGVTFGWLDAAFSSVKILNAERYLKTIQTPILIGQAGQERLVDNQAMDRAVGLLPNVALSRFADARHELFMERDETRRPLLERVDQFFADKQA